MKAPNWLGPCFMGPLRLKAYSRPMRALPSQLLAMVLSVGALRTLKTSAYLQMVLQVGAHTRQVLGTEMPRLCKWVACPSPDNSSICGEPIEPAHSSTRHGRWRSPSASVPNPHAGTAQAGLGRVNSSLAPGRCSTTRSWGGHSRSGAGGWRCSSASHSSG